MAWTVGGINEFLVYHPVGCLEVSCHGVVVNCLYAIYIVFVETFFSPHLSTSFHNTCLEIFLSPLQPTFFHAMRYKGQLQVIHYSCYRHMHRQVQATEQSQNVYIMMCKQKETISNT